MSVHETDLRAGCFADFFKAATGCTPYGWQLQVACLPMRSLVTQTVQSPKGDIDALRPADPKVDVGVHQLMPGAIDEECARWPEKPWVLVGAQDQLMGPGLWPTSQLDWMRRQRFPSLKPCLTTWMRATVGTSFLSTTDRTREGLGKALQASRFRREDRARHEQSLLEFDADRRADKLPEGDRGLICVSTQVVEAGADIPADRAQSRRFGRPAPSREFEEIAMSAGHTHEEKNRCN